MVSLPRRNPSEMIPLSTLLKSGFTPTLKDSNNFLLFLYRNRKFKAIIHVFSQVNSNKINADAQTHTIFAKALLKENKYEEAAEFLKTLVGKSKIFDKNRVLDSLLQGVCTFNQDPERGYSLLKNFLKIDGICPSSRTFCLLVCSFSKMGKMDRVIDLLELMSDDKFKYPFDNYVCSSVISGFVRIGEPELAVGFYETAVKSGSLKPNTVTCTSVLTAYCKLRNMDKVYDLVSWMENNELAFDVVFYSNWVYGCLSEGLIYDAFRKYKEMVDKKVELDIISYTILIDGFSKDGNVEKAVGFLYKMRKDGLEPNLISYTAIILGFCKKGKLDEAFAIFNMFEKLGIQADEFTYAILINGVCRKGDFDLVFQLLDEMEKKGINPGIVIYNTVINGLCKVGRMAEADDFSKGIVGDVVTYTTLLQGYVQEESNSGILETTRRLEAAGIHMDLIMCNILIKALLMVGLFEDAFAIYKRLLQMDLSANSVTYYILIDGYCKAGRIDEALEIFDEFRKVSNSSAACYNCIISGLCRKDMIDMAIDVLIEYIQKGLPLDRKMYMMLIEATFDRKGAEGVLEMIYRIDHIGLLGSHVICNNAISFLCKMGFPEASYNILLVMKRKGLVQTSFGYYSILRLLLLGGKKLLAQLILTSFVKTHGMSNLSVCKILVNYLSLHNVKKALLFLSTMNERQWRITIPVSVFKTLTNDGRVCDAYELLVGAENNLCDMNVFYYTIMIDALCKGRHIDKALDLCTLAKKKGIALNIVTYNSVINGLCSQGCLVEAFRLFDSLERVDVLPTEVTYGTLIDALVKEGLLKDARLLFERMFLKNLRPATRIYNSLINGYCKSTLLEEAIKLFQDFELRDLKPDGFTVGALINGYCQKGDMEGALKLFIEFKSKSLLPDFLGFMHLIRGLCAKGRMEESRSILREMLQIQSVIDVLGRVDTGVESGSVENLLIFLCERGSIHEAVTVLDEVASMLFSAGGNSSHQVMPSIYNGTDFHSLSSDAKNIENMLKICTAEDGEKQQLKDFDSFYSLIHSLCLKGELAKANRFTKLLMEF
ncbi:pentatricopeptide repeat-containing protein At5g57250, mitochondrial [Sesamum indicum]|uniref:Pentatricopeptide repeat-containing protein At5g57250, mitochondrial n=1 Tax=Sesamum indicum TaxID=4182 RepID=A0A6I9T416_SESIN|nr:pentatricopeptide repeat-containing protein At5g57250, mitochondrial [Sesamum indicum]XP_011077717.1 pentatricopeptide repeat-containing protein At5g57250, mitochondrial [Sesamum indicum]XP_011077718.1 pentatricopeptide repeat-containing protein At5g57250, mitochondrial [Sesamum indicum]XP_011077719.1 pentatricopeptide repeat-containing protein At5g57250, mitochondrial [Sesamum indicum]XP_011077720.1 pentatricopeptide repeat-containing protein At5g57250, mitochondrial [Sesamum indicum]XP_01